MQRWLAYRKPRKLDFGRLATVLSSQRHFDLVSEGDVRYVRDQAAAEIAPHLRELIARAEELIAKDERHMRNLRSKAAQVLAELDESKPITTSSPSVSSIITQAELSEHRRQLADLQRVRARLMERMAALEREMA
ncbi:hypothetical protein MCUN1_002936 [Malassezia cuniculi]|uniref:DASH complex subunit SPC19 n=1 Tax=Malassezia cuniculi TaxID=948313 RepID=A0AAF0EVZ9_9BASI|nr:hypothetical protein MCUN1_002936 [Malassezia cuniculi]